MRIKLPTLLAALAVSFGAAGPMLHAAAPTTAQGLITGKEFSGITGTTVANLTNNAKFPNNPDRVFFHPYFEWNATGDIFTPPGNFGDNYGGQMVGYFYPPTTGDYVFYLAADDNAVLYLSTTANAADKKVIARETAWSNAREYLVSGGSSDLTAKDTSQYLASEWPTKDPGTGAAKITLQAGQPYYIEALFKEGTGGDFLSVAVQDPNFVIDSTSPIPGEFLSSDRDGGPATIVTQPQSQTVAERGSVTFQVVANGTPPYTYQWRKGGADILNATNLTYTATGVPFSDNNVAYSVVVTGAEGGSVTSQDAVVTVTPDTTAPTVLGSKASPGGTEVVISFSEPVDPVSGAVAGNYQIASAGGALNVTGTTVAGTQVILTTAPQTLGTKYTITINGVRDTAATANTIAADTKSVFLPTGDLQEINGMIVFEAENFNRNLDELWVRNTTRGTPSGGVSMTIPNGVGGSETATKLEYDVNFGTAGTYYVWVRASADVGEDDSVWIHLDGDGDGTSERPFERSVEGGAAANSASLSGFQPQADFVWTTDSQDGPDPFTIEVPSVGSRIFAIARREDGASIDKIILTTDSLFTPTGFGPPETREGAPGLPTVAMIAPTAGQTFNTGANVTLSATAAGQSGLNISRVQFTTNGVVVGEDDTAPYSVTWANVPEGVYGIRAIAIDEIGQSTTSDSVAITVGGTTTTGARIAWISFHTADETPSTAAATAGFTNAADVEYTRLLEGAGHAVTRFRTSGTPDTNVLNTFDLVIISRSVPSGDYETAAETAAWNGITAPTMILGGYIIRANRLGLMTGNTIPDTVGPIKLTVTDTNHPIFQDISFDAAGTTVNDYADIVTFTNFAQRGISVVMDPVAGEATVLATVGTAEDATFGGTIIAEWNAGAVTGNARADVLAGERLLFLTGSREHNGLTSEGAGIIDLTEDGRKMFLNAVNYLAGTEPQPERTKLGLTRTAQGQISIQFEGTLQSTTSLSTPNWGTEATVSPHTVAADQPVKFYRAVQN